MLRFEKTRMACFLAIVFFSSATLHAINITVDYRYDSNSFFDPATVPGQQARAALEAAAARYSEIITTSLGAVSLVDDSTDVRIGFTHPGIGGSWDVSSAVSSATDSLPGAGGSTAQEYRGPWSIAGDEWILYAGGRSIGSAGQGGTGTGLNFESVFDDENSVLNRGFRDSGSTLNLPVWGGAITFDNDGGVNWHFDYTTAASSGTTDFYSIAMHEIGHVLGLGSNWDESSQWSPSGVYSGPQAVAAYNADNGTSLSGLNLASSANRHWQDGTYDSNIFAAGSPNVVGTVGLGNPQDLLMEPIANFVYPTVRRFELTNVDVAALEDLGWSVISAPVFSADFDGDGDVDGNDLNDPVDGWEARFGVNLGSSDFLDWQRQFGSGVPLSSATQAVPEPSTMLLSALASMYCLCRRFVGR